CRIGVHGLLVDGVVVRVLWTLFWHHCFVFVFTVSARSEIYTLSLHDALPICRGCGRRRVSCGWWTRVRVVVVCGWRRTCRSGCRSGEWTCELQSREIGVCSRLLDEKRNGGFCRCCRVMCLA